MNEQINLIQYTKKRSLCTRLLPLLLAMGLLLAGCSGGTEPSEPSSDTGSSTASASSTPAASAPEPEPEPETLEQELLKKRGVAFDQSDYKTFTGAEGVLSLQTVFSVSTPKKAGRQSVQRLPVRRKNLSVPLRRDPAGGTELPGGGNPAPCGTARLPPGQRFQRRRPGGGLPGRQTVFGQVCQQQRPVHCDGEQVSPSCPDARLALQRRRKNADRGRRAAGQSPADCARRRQLSADRDGKLEASANDSSPPSTLKGFILTTMRTAILFTRWRTRPWGTEKKRLPS